MNISDLARAALAIAALGAAAPALAQDYKAPESTDPSGPHNFMPGRSVRNVSCVLNRQIHGVDHRYRAQFTLQNNMLSASGEGSYASATAFARPSAQVLTPGVQIISGDKTGLRQSAIYREDRGRDYATSYELDVTLVAPGAADEPLISRAFLNGRPIWYQGLHQPKGDGSHFRIERTDKLESGAEPLRGDLRFVFERGGNQVAELRFDASSLAAREFAEATTQPLLDKVYFGDAGGLPGCR